MSHFMNATHCYVGTKPCGCTVAVVVDAPEFAKETAKSVSEFIRDGLIVERVSMDDGRARLRMCEHGRTAGLFDSATESGQVTPQR